MIKIKTVNTMTVDMKELLMRGMASFYDRPEEALVIFKQQFDNRDIEFLKSTYNTQNDLYERRKKHKTPHSIENLERGLGIGECAGSPLISGTNVGPGNKRTPSYPNLDRLDRTYQG